jgi:hypothetical protein
MPTNITYKQIQNLRELLMEEMRKEFGGAISLEHYKLLEMRLQTLLMIDSDDFSGIRSAIREYKKP